MPNDWLEGWDMPCRLPCAESDGRGGGGLGWGGGGGGMGQPSRQIGQQLDVRGCPHLPEGFPADALRQTGHDRVGGQGPEKDA